MHISFVLDRKQASRHMRNNSKKAHIKGACKPFMAATRKFMGFHIAIQNVNQNQLFDMVEHYY